MLFKPYKIYGLREIYRAKPEDPAPEIIEQYDDIRTIPQFPQCLHIETTSFCDNNCLFCTRSKLSRTPRHMPLDLFKRIIDECAEHKKTSTINLFKDGDPILAPELPRMIRYAKEKKAARKLFVATGGNALSPKLSEEIIRSGLDDICFSLDVLTEQQYTILKRTSNYGRVISNILEFVRLRDKIGSDTPTITVKALETDLVKDDLDLFVRLWINVVDNVMIDREFSSWDGTCEEINENFKQAIIATYSSEAVRYPCNRPWYMASIYADGKVTICPEDWAQKMIIGDMNNDSLYDIWNGDILHDIKRKHIENEYTSLMACKQCKAHILKNSGDFFRKNREIALKRIRK